VRARRRAPTWSPRHAWNLAQDSPSRLLSGLLSVIVLTAAAWMALAPAYRVSGAEISGNRRLGDGALYRAAEIEGRHVLLLDPAAAARKLEALPQVRSAWVDLRLPAKAHITVVETRPVLLLSGATGAMAVDEAGVVIPPPVDPSEMAELIAVRLLEGEPPAVGTELGPDRVAAAMAIAARFDSLAWDGPNGFVVGTEEGWTLRLGSDPLLVERQLDVLEALRPRLAPWSTQVAMVDLRFPTRPYYRLRSAENRP